MSRLTGSATLAVAITLTAVGCSSPATLEAQGQTGVHAVFVNGGLSGSLPPDARVPSVIAAADQALASAGYIITGRDTTLHTGRLVARYPDGRLGRRVDIRAKETRSATVFTVTMKPAGDEAASRDMFERVLTRLGL